MIPVEQGKIHPPGVESHAVQLAPFFDSGCDPGLDLAPESQDIPMNAIVEPHRSIGEAVSLSSA